MPDLPPPLPPHERTVGQLIGETIRAYGAHFWTSLALGIPLVIADELSGRKGSGSHALVMQLVIFWATGPLIAGAYVWACSIVQGVRPDRSAFVLALLIYLPFPLLRAIYILPAVAWFALVGLAVPAAMVERLPLRAAFARGIELGRADYVHALGSLAALVLVVGIGEITLTTLLRDMGDASARVALGLADFTLTPLLFLGGALLYTDQAARVRTVAAVPAAEG